MEKFIVGNTTFNFKPGVLEDLDRNYQENLKLYRQQHKEPVGFVFNLDLSQVASFIHKIFIEDDSQVRTITIDTDFFDKYFKHFAVSNDVLPDKNGDCLVPQFDFDAPQIEAFIQDFLS